MSAEEVLTRNTSDPIVFIDSINESGNSSPVVHVMDYDSAVLSKPQFSASSSASSMDSNQNEGVLVNCPERRDSDARERERRREIYLMTARAQRQAIKSFSDTSIHTLPSTNTSVSEKLCRICHCAGDSGQLISPCYCKGSLRYVHEACLQQWLQSSGTKACELCRHHFSMETKLKPIHKWRKLTLTTRERESLMWGVMFHVVTLIIFFGAICVVVGKIEDRQGHVMMSNSSTANSSTVLLVREKDRFKLDNSTVISELTPEAERKFPFWTKLAVVIVGSLAALAFLYVQCRIYVNLCRRLKATNCIIRIKNQPSVTSSLDTSDDLASGSNVAAMPDDSLDMDNTTV